MFDYDKLRAYAEDRSRELLRESEVLRLLSKPRPRNGLLAQLIPRTGDLLIRVGMKLKAAYQTENSANVQSFMRPLSETQGE